MSGTSGRGWRSGQNLRLDGRMAPCACEEKTAGTCRIGLSEHSTIGYCSFILEVARLMWRRLFFIVGVIADDGGRRGCVAGSEMM